MPTAGERKTDLSSKWQDTFYFWRQWWIICPYDILSVNEFQQENETKDMIKQVQQFLDNDALKEEAALT